jgi:SAM-dependent methyltransferase
MRELPLETDSQDRVFCLSVMEHVPPPVARLGMQEFARVLRPGGRAIVTLDLSMWFELNRPLDLVWDSGLTLLPPIDLRWPRARFGRFERHGRAADVLGLTLVKDDTPIETEFSEDGNPVATLPAYRIPTLIPRGAYPPSSLWQRFVRRIRRQRGRNRARA